MSIISQLKKSLPKNIVISGEENTRPFECDGLSVYKQKPMAVVLPNEVHQVKKVLEICRKNNTPIVTRGAGTGLSGGAMPLKDSVVLGLSKLTKVISINPEEQTAVVQPGVRNLAIAKPQMSLVYIMRLTRHHKLLALLVVMLLKMLAEFIVLNMD